MNYNRRRNIFTLGDFQTQQNPQNVARAQLSRRKGNDLFERDPFKVNSYNFRYADRPQFPLQSLVNRIGQNSTPKRFETFYYNYDFATSRHDKENSSTNQFHEHRRRKFLLDQTTAAGLISPPVSPCGGVNGRPVGAESGSRRRKSIDGANAITTGDPSSIYGRAAVQPPPQLYGNAIERECLQGLREIPASGSQNGFQTIQPAGIQHYHATLSPPSRGSRTSLVYVQPAGGRRLHSSPSQHSHASGGGGGGGGTTTGIEIDIGRIGGNDGEGTGGRIGCTINGTQRDANNCSTSTNDSSFLRQTGLRTSTSQHRQFLQPPNVLSDVVTHPLERKNSSVSGCNINIKINGLDDNGYGENLTIKIEADGHNDTTMLSTKPEISITNNLNKVETIHSHGQTSSTSGGLISPYGLHNTDSSGTFRIDKRISKFSISCRRENDAEQKIERLTPTSPRNVSKATAKDSPRKSPRKFTPTVTRSVSIPKHTLRRTEKECERDRRPSVVPWRTDIAKPRPTTKHYEPCTNTAAQLRCRTLASRLQSKYNIRLTDPRTSKPITNRPMTTLHRPLSSPRVQDSKPLNTVLAPVRVEVKSSARGKKSNLSLRSCIEGRTGPNQQQLKSTSDTQLRRTTSVVYEKRQNTCKSPFNVNINVYADKLRLLRV